MRGPRLGRHGRSLLWGPRGSFPGFQAFPWTELLLHPGCLECVLVQHCLTAAQRPCRNTGTSGGAREKEAAGGVRRSSGSGLTHTAT